MYYTHKAAIGGYIEKRVCSKLSCSECLESLKTLQFEGLIKSQDDVECFIQVILFKKQPNFLKTLSIELQKNWLRRKYLFDYVNIKICNVFVLLHSNLFLTMDNHCFEFLKQIVSCYCSIRFKSHAHEQNENTL